MAKAGAADPRIEKEMTRAARYLTAGDARAEPAADRGKVLLRVGERGGIAIGQAAMRSLARRRLIAERGGRLSLTASGRAYAKRSEATGDPFQDQHRTMATRTLTDAGDARGVAVNLSESPLGNLARRKGADGKPFLDAREVNAGERLRADYTRGLLMPRVSANWQSSVASGRRDGSAGGIAELTDAAIAARRRVENAIDSVGPELSGVLIDVCCFLKGLETVESERGWPVRSAKIVLKTALAALSRHYEPERRRSGRSAILHWGGAGYRPSMR